MDKRAAADFLGVSVRTLERLAASGKLTKRRGRGKTRPSVAFDESELQALKEELDQASPQRVFRRLNTEKPKDAIGFRLDPSYVQRLEAEGAKTGMSTGEFARHLVIKGLESSDARESAMQIQALRSNLGEMFYLILVQKLGASEEEAERIVASMAEGT